MTGQCIPAFTADTSNCPTVVFTDFSTSSSGVIVAWAWDFGDGNSANAPNVSHTFSANGTYTVCLTITTSTFCSSNFCMPITISCIEPPSCNVGFQYTLEQCLTISFFDGSTASPGMVTSWAWDFGDGTSSNQQHPMHTYSANGAYVSCLTITTSDACVDTFCDTISINCFTPPSCNAGYQYTLALCPTISYLNASTSSPGVVNTWLWDFGDGTTSNQQHPTHTYIANGAYVNCLTISTTDGCIDTYCDTISINCITPPSCSAGYQYTLALCPTISYLDASTSSPGVVNTWFWDFGDGTTSNQQHPTHTYIANGAYVNCLTISTTDGCIDTYCDTIVVNCNNTGNIGICTDEPTEKLDIQGGIRIRELPQEIEPVPRMIVADELGVLYWRPISPPPGTFQSVQPIDVMKPLESQAKVIEQLKARIEELEKKLKEH